MYNEKDRMTSGFTPYVPPDLTVDADKRIKYDDVGNIKAIVPVEKTQKEQIKLDFQRVKKYVCVFVVFCIIMECYYFVTTFRAWKWQVKVWRPLIVNNLLKGSSGDMADHTFIARLQSSAQDGTDVQTDDYFAGKREQLRSVARKNSVLLMTGDEIREIFGEPASDVSSSDFGGYTDEYTLNKEVYTEEYFNVYGGKYLIVYYCADVCIGVGYTEK